MNKIVLFLVLAFVVELLFMVAASQYVSVWLIFWWLVVAAFFGIAIIRKNVAYLIPSFQGGKGDAKHDPATALLNILCGMMLVFPGLLGDALAIVLLLPPVQMLFKRQATVLLGKYQQTMMQNAFKQMTGGGASGPGLGGLFGGSGTGSAGGGEQMDLMGELRRRMEEMQRAAAQAGGNEDNGQETRYRRHPGRKPGEIIDIVAEPVKKSDKSITHQHKDAAND